MAPFGSTNGSASSSNSAIRIRQRPIGTRKMPEKSGNPLKSHICRARKPYMPRQRVRISRQNSVVKMPRRPASSPSPALTIRSYQLPTSRLPIANSSAAARASVEALALNQRSITSRTHSSSSKPIAFSLRCDTDASRTDTIQEHNAS